MASTGVARTAHTPEAGRGAPATTAQSPAAKRWGCSSTCRLAVVTTRPVAASTGNPAAASQAGARLPVQARSAGATCGTFRSSGIPASASSRSPSRLAAAEPSRSPWPRSSRRGPYPRALRARASSTAAAPPPRMRSADPGVRVLSQARKGSRGFTGWPLSPQARLPVGCVPPVPDGLGIGPSGSGPSLGAASGSALPLAVTAPTSRLSRSKRSGGRPSSRSSRATGSSPTISARRKVTPARAQSRRRSMALSSAAISPATRAGSVPE